MSTRQSIVRADPNVMSGEPGFAGTRMPGKNLLDYLAADDSVERFLDHIPSIRRERAVGALEGAGGLPATHAGHSR